MTNGLRLLGLAAVFVLLWAAPAFAGEALPPGPPWLTDWRSAKREALSKGRPIFAYFTKRY